MAQPAKERELPPNYPMYYGYLYVIDGEVVQYSGEHMVVGLYRQRNPKVKSVKNCDISGRNLWHLMI